MPSAICWLVTTGAQLQVCLEGLDDDQQEED
jgi:hypothetical protein